MRKTKEQKAITLIALIITIVVLLILAVVAINEVTGEGIIQHATNAKAEYEKAQDEENKILSYYQTYLDAKGQVGKWIQDKENIKLVKKDGSVKTIGIGDFVEYNPLKDKDNNDVYASYISYASIEDTNNKNGRASGHTSNQEFNVTDYSGTWQILGIENGQILLVSSNNINKVENSEKTTYYLSGKYGYQYGTEELNAICSIYGKGLGAESARSITVEDINRITGYDAEEAKFYKDHKHGYGNEVTYKINENGYLEYVSIENEEPLVTTAQSFEYRENNIWKTLNKGESKTFKSTLYVYYANTLTEYTDTEEIGISLDGEIGNMLFSEIENNNDKYWLASPFIATAEYLGFGFNVVGTKGCIGYNTIYKSKGENVPYDKGIRAVIKLEPNVILEDRDNDETYEIYYE